MKLGTQSKDLLDTRWVLTWKEVEGEKTVKARLVATGYQDPDLQMGNVKIAGCVSSFASDILSFEIAMRKSQCANCDVEIADPLICN